MALGTLQIQKDLKSIDEETVLSIMENLYLQRFMGMEKWNNKASFDAFLMVWFRKRLSVKFLGEINEEMCTEGRWSSMRPASPKISPIPQIRGFWRMIQVFVSPIVSFKKTDELIDEMHKPDVGKKPRPRIYWQSPGKFSQSSSSCAARQRSRYRQQFVSQGVSG